LDKQEKAEIQYLDGLIRKKEQLIKLTKHSAWKVLLKELAEIRVGLIEDMFQGKETADYAKAVNFIVNFLKSLDGTVELDSYISRKKSLLEDIERIEQERLEQQRDLNQGLGSVI